MGSGKRRKRSVAPIYNDKMKKEYDEIRKMVEDKNDDELCSMICFYEGKLNNSSTYTVIGIGYALLIAFISCFFSLILNSTQEVAYIILFITLFAAFAVSIIALNIHKKDRANAVIVRALYFALEERKTNRINQGKCANFKKEDIRSGNKKEKYRRKYSKRNSAGNTKTEKRQNQEAEILVKLISY